jgi:hypothetical protein
LTQICLHDARPIVERLQRTVDDDPFWNAHLDECVLAGASKMHLAVFRQPFLSLLLAGKKTIESRFSVNRVAPFEAIRDNDLILLKEASGPVVGIALAGAPGFYHLDEQAWSMIRMKFATAICATDDSFWEQRAHARYATLIPIKAALKFEPFTIAKRDRRGWVLLPAVEALELPFEQQVPV